jgi:hypothetical protein
MKEILTCDIWTGVKVKIVIDRETGEFVLFNSRFRLVVQDDKAYLMDYIGEGPLFTGYLRGNVWYFEELEYVRKDQDPYVAVIQVLYDVLQYY